MDKGPNIHKFLSSGEAYDASQCDDNIEDGDILVAGEERSTAILVEAWPVVVSGDRGAFHSFSKHGETWTSFRGGRYLEAACAAIALAGENGWAIKPKVPVLNEEDIILEYSSIDHYAEHRTFDKLDAAKEWAQLWLGACPDVGQGFGPFDYAVSSDGIGKVRVLQGCILKDLFPRSFVAEEMGIDDWHHGI